MFHVDRELYLDEAIEEAEQLLECIKKPHTDEAFSSMAKKMLFVPMTATLKPLYNKLQQAKQKLDRVWRGSEAQVSQQVEHGYTSAIDSQSSSVHMQVKKINKVECGLFTCIRAFLRLL